MKAPLPAFAATSGSRTPRMVILGEAWGEQEARVRAPFVGASGQELFRCLGEAAPELEPELHARVCEDFQYDVTGSRSWVHSRSDWLAAAGICMTNVFALRPEQNQLESLCYDSKQAKADPAEHHYPAVSRGKYLRSEFYPELERLREELTQLRPNLILALGNTAIWATLGATNIGSIRGAITHTAPAAPAGANLGCKLLPAYHPAAILRSWHWRPILVADCIKAFREADFPDVRRIARRILVDPTLEEIILWCKQTLEFPPEFLFADIETESGQITKISFARTAGDAIVIPFWDRRKLDWNYWQSQADEWLAWMWAKRLLESPIPKGGQNFIYDLQYITRTGIRPQAVVADTMLLHHALFPEMQKGLGFLASIYSNEFAYKLLRRHKSDTEKRDE